MAKVLMFSRDPGGANVIVPLVSPMRARGHEVVLLGKDMALARYRHAGLEGTSITDRMAQVTQESIMGLLRSEGPDAVVTGTSADDFSERFLWKAAEILAIPSLAVLDQWLNYGVRFSDYAVSEIGAYLKRPRYSYLPTRILVMDETAVKEAIEDGLNADRLIVTGHPHFQSVLNATHGIKSTELGAIRARLGAGNGDFLVTFASEPISDQYGGDEAAKVFWGYNERSVFDAVLHGIERVSERANMCTSMVIRLHPKENPAYFEKLVAGRGAGRVSLMIDRHTDSVRLIMASNLVCGMSSMFLFEAAVVNTPVMSVQIGLKRENPFLLDRMGIVQSVLDPATLERELLRFMVDRIRPMYKLDCTQNAVENIILQVEKCLWQSSQ